MKSVDLLIIGGGSAGMAAALSARKQGIQDILILERDKELGGILNQCIHTGFGLKIFKEELSGPSFSQNYINMIKEENIDYELDATVLDVNSKKRVIYQSPKGLFKVNAKSIILASGCYERTRGSISIPGTRVKGVYTAGAAQKYINIENVLVGKKVFILGSGDIGLIMARRLTLEGAKVLGVAEIMPYSNGLMRNIVQCLEDYQIPLYLKHTVTNIIGKDHLERIVISEVDESRQIISGTEKEFEVDTLLLSVGLIPDNTIMASSKIKMSKVTKGAIVDESLETSVEGIFACGNALHVHDLVDFVALEATEAGKNAAEYLLNERATKEKFEAINSFGVSYVLPQLISRNLDKDVTLSYRVNKNFKDSLVEFYDGEKLIKSVKKRYLLPAEMERIVLKKDELNSIKNNLVVKVVEL